MTEDTKVQDSVQIRTADSPPTGITSSLRVRQAAYIEMQRFWILVCCFHISSKREQKPDTLHFAGKCSNMKRCETLQLLASRT